MALHPPRTPGTDAYVRIYNTDGSEAGACGNGMRCVAELLFARDRQGRARPSRRTAGMLNCWKGDDAAGLDRRHGQAALRLERDSAGRGVRATPARSSCRSARSTSRSCIRPRSVSMGNPHAIFWVDDVTAYDLDQVRPAARKPSDLSRARQHLARPGDVARAHHRAHLGARRRADQGLRLGRLRGGGRGRAATQRTGRKVTVTLPGGDLHDRMARARRSRPHDRPGRVRVRGPLRSRRCSRRRGAA